MDDRFVLLVLLNNIPHNVAKYISRNPVMTSWEPSLSPDAFFPVGGFCSPTTSLPWQVQPGFFQGLDILSSILCITLPVPNFPAALLLTSRHPVCAEAPIPFQRQQTPKQKSYLREGAGHIEQALASHDGWRETSSSSSSSTPLILICCKR